MREKFLTFIGYYDEFDVNLLFDRSIYRSMCTPLPALGIPTEPHRGVDWVYSVFSSDCASVETHQLK